MDPQRLDHLGTLQNSPVRLAVLPVAGVCLLVGVFAAWNLKSWGSRILYPGDLNRGVEGIVLTEMIHLREGIPIYSPDVSRGFHAAAYGPLYYLAGSRAVDPLQPSYFRLRVVAALATLGCAILSGVLAYSLTSRWMAAVMAPLVYLSFSIVTEYDISCRSDATALLFAFAGFLVAYRFRNSRRLLFCVPFLLASYFLKQQFFAGALGIFLYLLLKKRYRLAVEFGEYLGLGWAALVVMFNYVIFPGQNFTRHFLTYIATTFSADYFVIGLVFFALLALVPALVGLLYLRAQPDRLMLCYLGCAVAMALVSYSRPGSDRNYFVETLWISSCLIAALLGKGTESPRAWPKYVVFLLGVLLCGRLLASHAPTTEDIAEDRTMQAYLRQNFPPRARALSYYVGDLVRAGLETPYSDMFLFSRLVERGVISDAPLVAQVRDRRFALIVLGFDPNHETNLARSHFLMTEGLLRAVREEYQSQSILAMPTPERMDRRRDHFYIFVPRMSDRSGTCSLSPAAP